ncbi:hypothetical protein NGTWS0302_21470 [Mycolicibacterium cyprinidarum]|uniref:DUF732 domain-containing protein n=1 Tax=Mycolicibacterium cyprinidarum TaxID=2860311 RepID=A0ABQ4VFH0_9MYCO|nr:hypothetical protein NGTWS0302_21470 [Mycolicibacterium sp. NGTWS0302]GJF11246.1 hypothetical protein NGTWS1803_19220 [Mycolicibacterium sp. NGTWS1803]GJF18537.1 hypothetical protein NGTWS1702_26670 [Mycolicibacterium sp. NGTWSNA01]
MGCAVRRTFAGNLGRITGGEGSVLTIRKGTPMVVAAALAIQMTTGVAWADPATQGDPGDPVGAGAADALLVAAQAGNSVAQACERFDEAITIAALNYEDFAYATAGTGDYVDYSDPEVKRSNVLGRTALRGAAAAALDASRTPGLPPNVSDPMQSWSVHATKLLFIMGLHRGGDALNETATQLNVDAHNAQMGCAMPR